MGRKSVNLFIRCWFLDMCSLLHGSSEATNSTMGNYRFSKIASLWYQEFSRQKAYNKNNQLLSKPEFCTEQSSGQNRGKENVDLPLKEHLPHILYICFLKTTNSSEANTKMHIQKVRPNFNGNLNFEQLQHEQPQISAAHLMAFVTTAASQHSLRFTSSQPIHKTCSIQKRNNSQL